MAKRLSLIFMKKLYLVEDTSFVVSLMNNNDPHHFLALDIFRKILLSKSKVRVVMPTTVFFETLFALLRNRIPKNVIQEKLWKLLMIDDVLNFPTLETTALRLSNVIGPYILGLPQNAVIQANDLIVLATSLDLECAPVVTFDKKMKTKFNNLHGNIFYCLEERDKNNLIKIIDEF